MATPLILFSAWLVQRDRAAWLGAMIAVLFGLSFWGPYVYALGDATNLAPLYAFIVGVLAQYYGQRLSHAPSALTATIAAILSVAIFCYCGTRKQTAPIQLVECLCAAWLVISIAWRPLAIFRPLDFGVVRFYGRISYSFYLLHVLGMLFAMRLIGLAGFPVSELPVSVAVVIVTIASILVVTPAAYFSWRLIEIPFVNFAKNIRPRLVQAPVSSR